MMKKRNKWTPLALLVTAGVLLLASTVGSTQAALTYYSENYSAEVTVSNIGISLLENGKEVSYCNYLEDDKWDKKDGTLFTELTADTPLTLGKSYQEELSVKNTGAIDAYVRVVLKKSWQNDADGDGVYEKNTTLSPELIKLNLLTGENGWVEDVNASTKERTVLYYTKPVASEGETPVLSDTLQIDPAVGTKVIKTETKDANGTTVVYTYVYDGYKFVVEAEVDAVQTHNAVDAIKSAWGVDVTVAADGSLSLR